MSTIAPTAVKLPVIAIVAVLAVSAVDSATRSRIAAQRVTGEARALALELDIPALSPSALPIPRPDQLDACVAGVGEVRILRGRAQGYGGPIDFDVALDARGRVRGVGIASEHETPTLADPVVARGSPYLRSLVGRDALAPQFALREDGGDVDAVSGATFTSRALISGVATTARGARQASTACNR